MKKHKKFLSLLMMLLMAILSIPAVVLAEDISKPPSEVSETTDAGTTEEGNNGETSEKATAESGNEPEEKTEE